MTEKKHIFLQTNLWCQTRMRVKTAVLAWREQRTTRSRHTQTQKTPPLPSTSCTLCRTHISARDNSRCEKNTMLLWVRINPCICYFKRYLKTIFSAPTSQHHENCWVKKNMYRRQMLVDFDKLPPASVSRFTKMFFRQTCAVSQTARPVNVSLRSEQSTIFHFIVQLWQG